MNYYISSSCWSSVFAVPSSIVDNYIKLASGDAVKVLLYILRHGGEKLSSQQIASAVSLSTDSVDEAFIFWEQANVLSGSDIKPQINSHEEAENKVLKPETPEKKPKRRENFSLTPSEIASRIEGSEEIKVLFSMAEESFGRILNHIEQREYIWMHDYLGLSTDVLLTLTAYCISIEKSNIKYIRSVAADWCDRDINTLEAAQEEIKRLEEKGSFNFGIMKAFGMSRKPTAKQQQFIDSWRERSYSMDLIEYAYEKTIETIDKLNFPYINKILENWYNEGLLTREKIDEANGARAEKKVSEEAHSYDLEDYKSLVNNFGKG